MEATKNPQVIWREETGRRSLTRLEGEKDWVRSVPVVTCSSLSAHVAHHGAIPSAPHQFPSLWCSPENMPASHAGDHRSEAGRDASFTALRAFSAMRTIGIGGSSVQFRVRAPDWQHRSRASAQVGFISSLCPGQHRRLRPFHLMHH